MRDFDEMKLARVIDACGGVDGRVKMQKIVYLLKMMGYDLPFDDFIIRQHGPFSRSVAWATDVLTGSETLVEDATSLGKNSDGVPINRYSYKVRDDIAPLIRKSFDVVAQTGKPKINKIASRLRAKERGVLEVAATRVYLEHEGLSGEPLEEEMQRIKGHLDIHFEEAQEFLEELRKDKLL